MALPDKTALLTLATSFRGAPFCRVEAKALYTTRLDVSFRGAPFVAASSSRQFNRWDGASWVAAPLKYWTGAAWTNTVLKRWDGANWTVA